jgi:hypothetical protein
VLFVIEPRASQTTVNVVNGVLTVNVPLTQLKDAGFELPSVRFLVEDALGLKPAIQAAVVRETDAVVARTEANLSKALGKPLKVTLDWDALFQSALYKSTKDYVSFIRRVPLPPPPHVWLRRTLTSPSRCRG